MLVISATIPQICGAMKGRALAAKATKAIAKAQSIADAEVPTTMITSPIANTTGDHNKNNLANAGRLSGE